MRSTSDAAGAATSSGTYSGANGPVPAVFPSPPLSFVASPPSRSGQPFGEQLPIAMVLTAAAVILIFLLALLATWMLHRWILKRSRESLGIGVRQEGTSDPGLQARPVPFSVVMMIPADADMKLMKDDFMKDSFTVLMPGQEFPSHMARPASMNNVLAATGSDRFDGEGDDKEDKIEQG